MAGIDPALAQKLMVEIPELKEFCVFVAEEAQALDSLESIVSFEEMTVEERGHEVTARIRAKGILKQILGPLVPTVPLQGRNMSEEYGVSLSD